MQLYDTEFTSQEHAIDTTLNIAVVDATIRCSEQRLMSTDCNAPLQETGVSIILRDHVHCRLHQRRYRRKICPSNNEYLYNGPKEAEILPDSDGSNESRHG